MRNATVRDRATPSLTRVVQRPLFTSYAFVAITGPWVPIRYTPGVRALLMSGEFPSIVARAAVEALRAAQELFRTTTTQDTLYRPGAACSASLGGGVMVEGVVMSVIGQKALVTALMFGQLREMTVELRNLRPRHE
jgi:transcription antitermination factor NusG